MCLNAIFLLLGQVPRESGIFSRSDEFYPSLDVSNLPLVVKNRVKGLKKLQFETINAEAEYYKEVHDFDIKYQKLHDTINVKKTKVIKGEHEPAGSEIDWPSDEDEESEEKKLAESLPNILERVSKAEKLRLHCCGTDKTNFLHFSFFL